MNQPVYFILVCLFECVCFNMFVTEHFNIHKLIEEVIAAIGGDDVIDSASLGNIECDVNVCVCETGRVSVTI